MPSSCSSAQSPLTREPVPNLVIPVAGPLGFSELCTVEISRPDEEHRLQGPFTEGARGPGALRPLAAPLASG